MRVEAQIEILDQRLEAVVCNDCLVGPLLSIFRQELLKLSLLHLQTFVKLGSIGKQYTLIVSIFAYCKAVNFRFKSFDACNNLCQVLEQLRLGLLKFLVHLL